MNLDDPTPCFGLSYIFDRTDARSHERAKAICSTCPVIQQCRANLRDVQARSTGVSGGGPEGTWAGVLLGVQGKKAVA